MANSTNSPKGDTTSSREVPPVVSERKAGKGSENKMKKIRRNVRKVYKKKKTRDGKSAL